MLGGTLNSLGAWPMEIEQVAQFYQTLSKDNLDTLPDIYHPEIVFADPAHQIRGIAALEVYFVTLYQNVSECRFTINAAYTVPQGGFLLWDMQLIHPKLSRGKPVVVPGITQIKFAEGKVIYHRDYFDLGQMIYEQLPLLGGVIRKIKQRLGQ